LVSLESIFHSAGIPVPAGLPEAAIKGTPALTRTARKIAGHRLFLLGDSAGYVEPFTGEGMAWALTAATAIVPLLQKVTRNGWSNDFVNQWQITFQSIVSREQKVCRLLSAALKRPWLLPPILATCRAFPSLTRYLVSQINRVPEALKVT
jgi:flavin-dependent dehydrogenase